MELLRLSEIPISDRDTIFYYSRAPALLCAALSVITAAVIIHLSSAKQSWLGYYFAGFILLVLLLYQKAISARFRASNWLVRMTDNGLFIKFRSYLNCHFPADDYTVVFLPYHEIRSAKLLHESARVPDGDGGGAPSETTRKHRVVELDLTGDSRQLAIAIASEQDTVLAKSRIGSQRPSTRYHHFPVRLPIMKRLVIEWSVVPDAQVFLDQLARHTRVPAPESTTKDLTIGANLDREEQENRLLELVESGQKLVAISEARRLYAYSLTEAQNFIDELLRKKTAHG